MSVFDSAFEKVLGAEGVLSMDPKDKGNWTGGNVGVGELKGSKYGISAAAFPHIDIANLSLAGAKLLAYNYYWAPIRGDQMPPAIAPAVFDMAYNQGIVQAAKTVQKACGAEVDGAIGPATIAKLYGMDLKVLMKNLTVERILVYSTLAMWPTYKHSWTDRSIGALITALGG